ncbi:MAG: NADH-quinone oxidoreductase subunit NuoE [Anaerolineaceae bacterium]|jgi:NADH:ubiquinone oxidoreductase subunit E|nr:NADH-quinone oxidoreductase subunit NuoE [Anaerolineaceae bacterium]
MTPDNMNVLEVVRGVVEEHGGKAEELIPILNDVNRTIGYLPKEALEEIGRLVKTPKSKVSSVATFYTMMTTKPRGRHVIQFCESAPCHVAGGREVWLAIQDQLGLEDGETSEDGKWTLITASCLGLCGVGPIMLVDEDMYGNVTPSQVPEILARYS